MKNVVNAPKDSHIPSGKGNPDFQANGKLSVEL